LALNDKWRDLPFQTPVFNTLCPYRMEISVPKNPYSDLWFL